LIVGGILPVQGGKVNERLAQKKPAGQGGLMTSRFLKGPYSRLKEGTRVNRKMHSGQ